MPLPRVRPSSLLEVLHGRPVQGGDVLATQCPSYVRRELHAQYRLQRTWLAQDVLARLRQRVGRVRAVDERGGVEIGDPTLEREPQRQARPLEVRRHAGEIGRGDRGRATE